MDAAMSAERAGVSRWLFLLCLLYTAAAALCFPSTFILVLAQYPFFRFFVYVPPVLAGGLLFSALIYQPRAPFSFIRDKLAERGKGAAIIIAVMILSATAFTTLKHEYAKLVPFFADPLLASLDARLHGGDPWRVLRGLLPPSLESALFLLYSVLWFGEVIAGVVTAAFLSDRGLRERYLAAFTLTVMTLSTAVRLLLSSAGPVFYDRVHGGARFADLIASLEASGAGRSVLRITGYLYTSYATDTTVLGTGIAAMPSLHVALAFLNALFFARFGRAGAVLGWSYFAAILFGSVYFGWHYALDGYVSMAVVLTLWLAFRHTGGGKSSPEEPLMRPGHRVAV